MSEARRTHDEQGEQPEELSGQSGEQTREEQVEPIEAEIIQHPARIDDMPGAGLVNTGALGGLPHLDNFLLLVSHIVKSDFVPRGLRGNEGATLACIMHGQEIGLRPMQALSSIHMIEGRPSLSPEAMRAMILEAGHSIRFKEKTAENCVMAVRRREWPAGEWEDFEYTIKEAREAGLVNKDNWKHYPKDMLIARTTARAARGVFPDVIRGLSYIPEEIESIEVSGSVVSSQPVREPQPIDPRAAMIDSYKLFLDADGQKKFKEWFLANELPKGESWPAKTLEGLPAEFIPLAQKAIDDIAADLEPQPIKSDSNISPEQPIDVEVVSETVKPAEAPDDKTGKDMPAPGTSKPSTSSPAPRQGDPAEERKAVMDELQAIRRELGISPPDQFKVASELFKEQLKKPVTKSEQLTNEQLCALRDHMNTEQFVKQQAAVNKVQEAFGEDTQVIDAESWEEGEEPF